MHGADPCDLFELSMLHEPGINDFFEGIHYRSFLAPLLFQRRTPVFPVGILLNSRDAEKRE